MTFHKASPLLGQQHWVYLHRPFRGTKKHQLQTPGVPSVRNSSSPLALGVACSIFSWLPQAFVPEFSVLFQFPPRLQLCNVEDQGTTTEQRPIESKLPKVWKSPKPHAMRRYEKCAVALSHCIGGIAPVSNGLQSASQTINSLQKFISMTSQSWCISCHTSQDVNWIKMIQTEQTCRAGIE